MKTAEEIAKAKYTVGGREWKHLEISQSIFQALVEEIQLDARAELEQQNQMLRDALEHVQIQCGKYSTEADGLAMKSVFWGLNEIVSKALSTPTES